MLAHAGRPRLSLAANIERIAAYTAAHPELRAAHHFLYDLRVGDAPRFVVMGINPGETSRDRLIMAGPTEETSRFDFHAHGRGGREAVRWTAVTHAILDGADHALTNVFFWSSRDGAEFRTRFGPLAASPHLGFCREMNRDLIEAYDPIAVILPGLGSERLCRAIYGLTHAATVPWRGRRLAERYTDGARPWLFTRHWTGAFGFSLAERDALRAVLSELSEGTLGTRA